MGCDSNFGDKYEECGFLLDEYKLIISQCSTQTYTDEEQKALNIFKEDKKKDIQKLIKKIEGDVTNFNQSKKLDELKTQFQELLEEESNISNNIIGEEG